MPELPEVEIIRRGLVKRLTGSVIDKVSIVWSKSMPVIEEAVNERIIGRRITGLRRRGKVIIIDLDNGYSLLIHLKMTGQLVLVSGQSKKPPITNRRLPNKPNAIPPRSNGFKLRVGGGHPTKSLTGKLPDKSTRVVFVFADDSRLFFNDQRKFGWIKLAKTSSVSDDKFLRSMGPEPLESAFRVADFGTRLTCSRRPVKAILLDQSTVAGIGNIYADEALHLAKVHPQRPGISLKQSEVKRLHAAVKTVMNASINYGGTSFTNYVNANGQKGDYLQHARVFNRQGQPCTECGTMIQKIKAAGRGTHICPRCQKL